MLAIGQGGGDMKCKGLEAQNLPFMCVGSAFLLSFTGHNTRLRR